MGLSDALIEIIGGYGAAHEDMSNLADDPEGYFGLDIESYYTDLDGIEFHQEIGAFINDPTLSGILGLVPGVGVDIQTGLNAVDDVIGLPGWVVNGDPNPNGPVGGTPPPPPPIPPSVPRCCRCCCKCS